jgi:hypothetical protein
MNQNNSIISVCRESYGNYWTGIHSTCAYNGHIIQYIRNIVSTMNANKHNKLNIFISDIDGIVDATSYSLLSDFSKNHVIIETDIDKFFNLTLTEVNKVNKSIFATLATRNVSRNDILLLPLDDNIFKNGLRIEPLLIWNNRISKVVWRGKENGSNIRSIILKMLDGFKYADALYARYDRTNFLDCSQQSRYKYILSIDGTCIASSHMWVFCSGAVPIIVTHPDNNFWFKNYLKHMENCVLIKYDLSDLCTTITWLVEHDKEAQQIAENAVNLSKLIFTPEFQKKYIEEKLESFYN